MTVTCDLCGKETTIVYSDENTTSDIIMCEECYEKNERYHLIH